MDRIAHHLLGIRSDGLALRSELSGLEAFRHDWTRADAAEVLEALTSSDDPAESKWQKQRQRLCSAYLAGVAAAQDELMLRGRRSFATAADHTARTLLKNRAATPG